MFEKHRFTLSAWIQTDHLLCLWLQVEMPSSALCHWNQETAELPFHAGASTNAEANARSSSGEDAAATTTTSPHPKTAWRTAAVNFVKTSDNYHSHKVLLGYSVPKKIVAVPFLPQFESWLTLSERTWERKAFVSSETKEHHFEPMRHVCCTVHFGISSPFSLQSKPRTLQSTFHVVPTHFQWFKGNGVVSQNYKFSSWSFT